MSSTDALARTTQDRINPSGIVPVGLALTLDAPHGREALAA